ncbi:lipocalin-like domain-containing protein [Nocardia jiangxiensis]|uniref:Lipocalin-like domain-containing protein n=1 Tax=Nocardia jiangxiensis TaxID=282685 RepID=A0ABW6SAF9_9NOCA
MTRSTETVRERLIGGWELVSFTGKTPSGRVFHPMGEHAGGLLLYTDNGLVGVNLTEVDRSRPDPDTRIGLQDDATLGPLARTYMAYSGTFTVDETARVVTHNFDLCFDPALVGTLQERHVAFPDPHHLELSVPDFALDNFSSTVSLLWHRV